MAYGFFPAPGTNYTVGDEPELARRLNTMAKSLHLHLIGISGYRSPAHSVAVGGFTDDPHTKGEASDTPGVEGVPESTLNQFGLTRPFPGAAEADHIQLSGSATGGKANASFSPSELVAPGAGAGKELLEGKIPNPLSSLESLFSEFGTATKILQLLTTRDGWVRIGKVVLGLLLLLAGVLGMANVGAVEQTTKAASKYRTAAELAAGFAK